MRLRATTLEAGRRSVSARTLQERRLARGALLALLLIGLVPFGAAKAQPCGATVAPDGTAGSCSTEGDGGNSPLEPDGQGDAGSAGTDPLAPSSSVGNPISLFTGNKRQVETDLSLPGASLSFRRFYNSANEAYRSGVGQGWSHTYAVSLFVTPEGAREILQSDGRRLHFEPAGADEQGRSVFRSGSAFEGSVAEAPEIGPNAHVWSLPDGRRLRFAGSFLVEIDWPDQRRLSLYYRDRRLASVTDETGRVLRFAYWPGAPGGRRALGGYEAQDSGAAAGQLASLTLPDGSRIEYGYDERSNLTRASFADGTQRQYHYEDETYRSRLTGLTDRTGVRFASWTYDDEGRAISSEHAGGVERVTLEYPDAAAVARGEEVVTRVTDSLGAKSEYRWVKPDDEGARPRLLASTGVGCATCPMTGMQWEHDADGRLERRTHRDEFGTMLSMRRYEHDALGRLMSVRESDGDGIERLIERREYAGERPEPVLVAMPSVAPGEERSIRVERSTDGLVQRVIERGHRPIYGPSGDSPSGHETIERITTLAWREDRLVSVDGPRTDVEDVTRFEWDANNRLVTVRPPGVPPLGFGAFDANGLASELRLGEGTPISLERDANANIAVVRRGELSVRYAHDAEGQLVSTTDVDGRTVRTERDEAGRIRSITDDIGRALAIERDTEGRIEQRRRVAVDGLTVEAFDYAFDPFGRLARTTRTRAGAADASDQPGPVRVTEHEHDAANGLRIATDTATGASVSVQVSEAGRRIESTDANGELTVIERDVAGRRVAVRDARQNLTREPRDDFGRPVMLDGPDIGRTLYRLDVAGNRVETRAPDAGMATATFDAAGRLTSRRDRDGLTTWRWDPATGRLAQAENPSTTERFAYDEEARLLRHERWLGEHRFETRYEYDSRGRLARKHLPDGQTLRHHYHEAGPEQGRLRAITRERLFGFGDQTLVADIDRDARDGRTGFLSVDGRRTTSVFAPNGDIQSLEVGDAMAQGYTFDGTGRIVAIEEQGAVQRYGYTNGRLGSASTLLGDVGYRYDALGNRTGRTARQSDGTMADERYTYPAPGQGNRLLARTDASSGASERYRYDAAGSPLEREGLSYEYDDRSRPTSVSRDGVLIARYRYNAFGERIGKEVYKPGEAEPTRTWFLYDGTALAAEVDGAGEVVAQYVYLDGHRAVAKLAGSEAYAVHGDHRGAPRLMADAAGAIVWQAAYAPFGEADVQRARVAMPLRLPGQYHDDETSTHYNYRRDYDPTTGRYLTSDPLGLAAGLNTYLYVGGDPLTGIDALGLFRAPFGGVFGSGRLGLWLARLAPVAVTIATANPVGAVIAGTVAVGALAWYYHEHAGGDDATFGEEMPSKPDQGLYQQMLNDLVAYSDTSIDESRYQLRDSWGNFFALHEELLAQQQRFVDEYDALYGSRGDICPIPGYQALYDRAVADLAENTANEQASDGTEAPSRNAYTAGYVSPEGVWFPSERAYQYALSRYEAAGGQRSTGMDFAEWWAETLGLLQGAHLTRSQFANNPNVHEMGQNRVTSGDSSVLRDNMIRVGWVDLPNHAAHHIVPHGDFLGWTNPEAIAALRSAQETLEEFGIDTNEAANGVLLPANSASACLPSATHSRIHTQAYVIYIANRLEDANTAREVRDILHEIARELVSGSCPY